MSHQNSGRILVAGIGNIFLGDDAFGPEVVRALQSRPLPPEVTVVDYGIRGLDLAYALLDCWRAVILIDAVNRGGVPGDLYLLETEEESPENSPLDLHSMDPFAVFRLARSLGQITAPVYVIGCQPADLGDPLEGRMGLSASVVAALPQALLMLERLLQQLARPHEPILAAAQHPSI